MGNEVGGFEFEGSEVRVMRDGDGTPSAFPPTVRVTRKGLASPHRRPGGRTLAADA